MHIDLPFEVVIIEIKMIKVMIKHLLVDVYIKHREEGGQHLYVWWRFLPLPFSCFKDLHICLNGAF